MLLFGVTEWNSSAKGTSWTEANSQLKYVTSCFVYIIDNLLEHSCKFAWFIPVQIPVVPNRKYPHSEVVICQTLLDFSMSSSKWQQTTLKDAERTPAWKSIGPMFKHSPSKCFETEHNKTYENTSSQQRTRSPAQSDQSFPATHEEAFGPWLPTDCASAQADLSLCGVHMWFCRLCRTPDHLFLFYFIRYIPSTIRIFLEASLFHVILHFLHRVWTTTLPPLPLDTVALVNVDYIRLETSVCYLGNQVNSASHGD